MVPVYVWLVPGMSYHSNVGQPDSEQNRIDSLLHLLAENKIEAFKTHLTAPRFTFFSQSTFVCHNPDCLILSSAAPPGGERSR